MSSTIMIIISDVSILTICLLIAHALDASENKKIRAGDEYAIARRRRDMRNYNDADFAKVIQRIQQPPSATYEVTAKIGKTVAKILGWSTLGIVGLVLLVAFWEVALIGFCLGIFAWGIHGLIADGVAEGIRRSK
jgi:hypothetical protein